MATIRVVTTIHESGNWMATARVTTTIYESASVTTTSWGSKRGYDNQELRSTFHNYLFPNVFCQ